MTTDDFAFAKKHDDVIAWHSTICLINDCAPIEIPYRAILPRNVENIIAPGRHISADNVAIDWCNLIPQCVGTGQAAGVAAAVAVAKGTTALALIVLGARFDFSRVSSLLGEITFGTLMRLVVSPVVGIGTGILLSQNTSLLSLTATEYPALISLFASPIAVSSAVMVGEIGGDEQLAGQLVVWTSVFSMFTMFGTIFIMKSFGFI